MLTQLRQIRSFVRREGRMTPKQQRALEQYWPIYGINLDGNLCNFQQLFSRDADTVLEIGFGMGASLIAMATAHPEINYIGIEVFRSGVGALLAELAEQQITNIRIYCADAIEVLQHAIPDKSLTTIQLFFPDPWPKKRHHKRRLVQADFVRLLSKKIKPGGLIHMATDWQDYAQQMLAVLSAEPSLQNLSPNSTYCPKPVERPLTKFESRGQRLGHGVWDLLFHKCYETSAN